MEIEMMKVQLKEYGWIKKEEEVNDEGQEELQRQQQEDEECPRARRRKRRQKGYYVGSRQRYCRFCKRTYKNCTVLKAHRALCRKEYERLLAECESRRREAEEEEEEAGRAASPVDGKKYERRPLVSCKDCKLKFRTTRELFKHRQLLDCAAGSSRDAEESDLSDITDEEYEYDCLYACAVCRAKFISRELLDVHRAREAHWGPRSRPKVDFVVVKRELEDFTYRSCEDNVYSCAGCSSGRLFYDPDDLLRHHRAAHSSADIYCRYCCLRLADLAEFNDHHRAYHELLDSCRICNDKDKPCRWSGKLPPKPWCLNCCRKLGLPYEDCLSLLREILYCEDCGRAMPSVEHVQFHNCAKQQAYPRGLPLPILLCPLCHDSFNSLRSLYRHVIRHNDTLSFRCDACGRLHETWKELKLHASRCQTAGEDMRLPRVRCDALRRHAEDIIRRFVKNGIKLLTN